MAETKYLDSNGVRTLLEEIYNKFAQKSEVQDYSGEINAINDRIDSEIADVNDSITAVQGDLLTVEEIKQLIKQTYDELEYGKYIVEDSASVLEALDAIGETGSLVLSNNLDLGTQILSIPEGKTVTLDLNGYTLNLNTNSGYPGIQAVGSNVIIENGTLNSTKRAIAAFNGGSITIGDNAAITAGDVAVSATGAGSEIIMNGGSVTAQETGLLVTTGAKVEMNGGTVTGLDNGPIMGNGSKGQGDVEIVMNGGELIANIQSAGYVAVGVYMPNSGTFTMNGGTITANGGAGVVCRGGQTILNGGTITTTAHPTLEVGKVGDSRVVVPCSAVVYDKNSKYPAMDSLQITIGPDMILNGAHEDITVISDEETPNIIDNREIVG